MDIGASVSLRKRLFAFVDAQLTYTFQIIQIDNVAPNASPLIAASAGNNNESSVALAFSLSLIHI